jgi:hypothetical protein
MKTSTFLKYGSIALILLSVMSCATIKDLLRDTYKGFSIEIPSGWVVLNHGEVLENRNAVQLMDKDIQEKVNSEQFRTLAVFAQHHEPYEGLNATIKVMYRELGEFSKSSPTEILRLATAIIRLAVKDYDLKEPVRSTTISGFNSAHLRVNYTIADNKGKTHNVDSSFYVIPRGDYMFVVRTMNLPADSDKLSPIFDTAIKSIKIEK